MDKLVAPTLPTAVVHHAFFTGEIADSLTGDAIRQQLLLTLAWRTNSSANYQTIPVTAFMKSQRFFSFTGQSTTFFPELTDQANLECQLSVQAEGYVDFTQEFTLPAQDITPVKSTESFAGYQVTRVAFLQVPIRKFSITLDPKPINLYGRVILGHDQDDPVFDAQVVISSPPTSGSTRTDVRGYFRINALPVVNKITVKITKNSTPIFQDVLLDYNKPMNTKTFSLTA